MEVVVIKKKKTKKRGLKVVFVPNESCIVKGYYKRKAIDVFIPCKGIENVAQALYFGIENYTHGIGRDACKRVLRKINPSVPDEVEGNKQIWVIR